MSSTQRTARAPDIMDIVASMTNGKSFVAEIFVVVAVDGSECRFWYIQPLPAYN